MDNFDLDNYKKTWQEQDQKERYNSNEILNMLNKKSINYVKFIFWISLAEFIFFVAMTIYFLISNENDTSILDLLPKFGLTKNQHLEADIAHLDFIIKLISLLLTGGFVLVFYKNYKKITVESNIKQFIIQIFDFKKTVRYFIFSNIVLLIIFNVVVSYIIYHNLQLQIEHLERKDLWLMAFTILSTAAFSILLVYIYYKIFYGILLNKLNKNLEQIKNIEQQNQN
jgi:hypothetical protein